MGLFLLVLLMRSLEHKKKTHIDTHLFRQVEKAVFEEHVFGLAPSAIYDNHIMFDSADFLELHQLFQVLGFGARIQDKCSAVFTYCCKIWVPESKDGMDTKT